jgi:hypothetical protein
MGPKESPQRVRVHRGTMSQRVPTTPKASDSGARGLFIEPKRQVYKVRSAQLSPTDAGSNV